MLQVQTAARLLPLLTYLHRLTLRELVGTASYCLGGCKLYAVCTYDQTLLEGGVRGACLQRHHVPPPYLPHNPRIGGVSQECFAHSVLIRTTCAVFEHYLIALPQLVQIIEDHTTPGSSKTHAMSCQVDVPLSTL